MVGCGNAHRLTARSDAYAKISHELLSKLLIAIVTDKELIGGNNRRSDVRSSHFGLISAQTVPVQDPRGAGIGGAFVVFEAPPGAVVY